MTLRMRRGGGIEPTPPPSQIYGPTFGAPSVRSGAGARSVSSPGTGISFNSSATLQSAINANPSNSTFVCSVNAPIWNSSVDTGTKAPTIIFPGPVGQKVINGGGVQVIPIQAGINTTIIGGTWMNFGSADTIHGIRLYGDNSIVQDAVVTGIWNSGIATPGNGLLVSHCTMHDNGQNGYSGGGNNMTIEYCDVYANNTRGVNPGFEGGAGKVGFTSAVGHFHHNYIHSNNGFGCWWDTSNSDWLIEENVSEFNARAGLFYEASDRSVIRNNLCIDNGSNITIGGQTPSTENCVQMRVADSNCISGRGDVSFNLLDFTQAQTGTFGMLFLLWNHTGTVARSVQNWDVHDNAFFLRGTTTQRVGGELAPGITTFPTWSSGNSFFSNRYNVTSMSTSYWKWDTGTGGGVAQTYAAWQGFHAGDNIARIQI